MKPVFIYKIEQTPTMQRFDRSLSGKMSIKSITPYLFLVGMISLLMSVRCWNIQDSLGSWQSILSLILFVVYFTWIFGGPKWYENRMVKRDGALLKDFGEYRLEFFEECIVEHAYDGVQIINYSDLINVLRDKEGLRVVYQRSGDIRTSRLSDQLVSEFRIYNKNYTDSEIGKLYEFLRHKKAVKSNNAFITLVDYESRYGEEGR